MIKKEIKEHGLIADFFSDDTTKSRKAIIMLGGSEGGKSWSRIKKPIELLVQKGYCVLSLAYFNSPGLPKALEEIPIEYFKKAIDWLSEQNKIELNEIAILGGSKGAEVALLLSSIYSQIKTVIAFSPSSVVWQGIPSKRFELGKNPKSSWSYKGKSVPFLIYPTSIRKQDLLLLRLRKMHEEALCDFEAVNASTIQVEKTQGAILLISGERDRMWPATKMGTQIMERLKVKEFDSPYEHIVFDTGHNGIIMNKIGWRKVFNFLEEHYT